MSSESELESVGLSEVENEDDQYHPPRSPTPPTPNAATPTRPTMATRMAEMRMRRSLNDTTSALKTNKKSPQNSDPDPTSLDWDDLESTEAIENLREKKLRRQKDKRARVKHVATQALQDAAADDLRELSPEQEDPDYEQEKEPDPPTPVKRSVRLPPDSNVVKKSPRKPARSRPTSQKNNVTTPEQQVDTAALLSQDATNVTSPAPVKQTAAATEARKNIATEARKVKNRERLQHAREVKAARKAENPKRVSVNNQRAENPDVQEVENSVNDTEEVQLVSASPPRKPSKAPPKPKSRLSKSKVGKNVANKDANMVDAEQPSPIAEEQPSQKAKSAATARAKNLPKERAEDTTVATEPAPLPNGPPVTQPKKKPARVKKAVKPRAATAKAKASKSLPAQEAHPEPVVTLDTNPSEAVILPPQDDPAEDVSVVENTPEQLEPVVTPPEKKVTKKRAVKPRASTAKSRAVKAPASKAVEIVEANVMPDRYGGETTQAQDHHMEDVSEEVEPVAALPEKKVARKRVAKPRTTAAKSKGAKAPAAKETALAGATVGQENDVGETAQADDERMEEAPVEGAKAATVVVAKAAARPKKAVKPRAGTAKSKATKAKGNEVEDVTMAGAGRNFEEDVNDADVSLRGKSVLKRAAESQSDEMLRKRVKQSGEGLEKKEVEELMKGAHLLNDLQSELMGYGKRQDRIVDRFVEDVCQVKERWRVCINAARWEMRRKQEEALRTFAIEVSVVLKETEEGALGDLMRFDPVEKVKGGGNRRWSGV